MSKRKEPLSAEHRKQLQEHINEIAETLNTLNNRYSKLRYRATDKESNDITIEFVYLLGEQIRDGMRDVLTITELLERSIKDDVEHRIVIHSPKYIPKDTIF